jgi:hypothetical protein
MLPIERVKFHLKPLVDQMLDQLPADVFTSTTTAFLDPAFGGGQFLREVVARLRAAGHADDNIRSRIYGCEFNTFRVKYALQLGRVISDNLITADYLSHDWGNMKFDVILGNPPYQDNMPDGARKSMSTNLWSKFIDKSVTDLLASNGWCAMVVPASWAGPTKNLSNNRRILKDIFAANNTTLLNLDPALNSYFQQVGSTFSWFMTQKGPYVGPTHIQLSTSEHVDVDLSELLWV